MAAVARGFALFIGGFTLASVVGSLRHAQADFTIWWVAVPVVGRLAGEVVLAVLAAALLGYAVVPRMRPWRRWPTLALVLAFAAVTAWNGAEFYRVWRDGLVEPGVPVPLSFVVCAVLAFVAWAALRPPAQPRRRLLAAAVLVVTASACVLAFPVAQVFFFGNSDYRRAADAVVVFGAQVHGDGHLSTSLRDRMTTAVDLYRDGLVDHLVVSGGVGDSGFNEAMVMRDVAIEEGVPAERIVVDSAGVNTDATVRNTMPFFGGEGWTTVLAVSQFYHLPRIKLAYQRAGWDVLTVPAGTSSPIPQTPTFVAREIPAFWLYYLRAVVR
ncbi:MAG: YdcF family protein [Actinobacteria bacterium]|nr:YdcF family protein [Actinomycetota bacterium]